MAPDLVGIIAAHLRAFDGDATVPGDLGDAEVARERYRNHAGLLLLAVRQHDDRTRLPTVWVCDTCGQQLGQNGRCNSGLHVGPGQAANGMAIDTRELVAERDLYRAAIQTHRDDWVRANGERELTGNARPADLRLWEMLESKCWS